MKKGSLKDIGAEVGDIVISCASKEYEVLSDHHLRSVNTGKVFEWNSHWNNPSHNGWCIASKAKSPVEKALDTIKEYYTKTPALKLSEYERSILNKKLIDVILEGNE